MKNEIKNGTILMSKPFIEDSRFSKSIILITEHNHLGTMGLIINKKSNQNIEGIFNEKFNQTIKHGGPVEIDSVICLHNCSKIIKDSQHVFDNYFIGGDIEQIFKHISSNKIEKEDIYFFIGYSGWEKGQLEQEITEGSWIIYENKINIFNDELSWSRMLIETNKKYKIWVDAPSNFHLN